MSSEGKYALITGSSRGIGRGIAVKLAEQGVKVAVHYYQNDGAVALVKRGITVNSLSPGLTEDSVLISLPQPVQDMSRTWHEAGWTPAGRLTTPADIGNAVRLLCSEEAGWITGQVIAVDGGASLMDTVFPLEIQRG